MTTWRLLDSGAMSPSFNMAIDQAILALHANGKAPPTLRFYQWQPAAVSLGYLPEAHNLNLDMAACDPGIEVVRRPSGGRAVLHLGDFTYAVIAGTADGIPSAVTAAYRLICDGLLAGFRLLGDRCRHGPRGHQIAPNGYLFSPWHHRLHCAPGEKVRGKRPDLARLLHVAARLHNTFSPTD